MLSHLLPTLTLISRFSFRSNAATTYDVVNAHPSRFTNFS
jgi:hypothetical protein